MDDQVEHVFEEKVPSIGTVDFMGQVSLLLGTEFTWVHHDDGHLTISLMQQSFIETLIDSLNITSTHISTFTTPYHSGFSIDFVPH